MNLKILFTTIATIIGLISFWPYIKDTLSLNTKPHAYTWLIWTLTQGTAVIAIWKGGGGWGAMNLTTGTILVLAVFLFSLKYGTKNITKFDTAVLILALVAILVWWQFHQPLIAVVMVTFIDLIGYIPTFRKSYSEPWSESLISWFGFILSNTFALLALAEYNLLTVTYILAVAVINVCLLLFCIIRRQVVAKPASISK